MRNKIFFILALLCASPAYAATINATSCLSTDIQAAIDSATTGDTVVIPPGNCFAGYLTMDGGINLQGAGAGQTTLYRTSASGGHLVVDGSNGEPFVISGITFIGASESSAATAEIWNSGLDIRDGTNFRVTDCEFIRFGHNGIKVKGYTTYPSGVIDNCTFADIYYPTLGTAGYGVGISLEAAIATISWSDSLSMGGPTKVFVEDSTFNGCRHAIASFSGARYVFRHNTVYDSISQQVDAHGPGFGSSRGTRSYEIYENTIYQSGPRRQKGILVRGGSGVIYNNTITNVNKPIVLGRDPLSVDPYPALDQIKDLYIWNNTHDGSAITSVSFWFTELEYPAEDIIQEDRDYFMYPLSGYTAYTYPHPLNTDTVVVPGPTDGVIVDNLDAEFATVGTWPSSTFTPGYYATNYVYNNGNGTGSETATWTFTVAAGSVDVYARWTAQAGYRASNATYTINLDGTPLGSTTVDQNGDGGSMRLIGQHDVTAGTLTVVLTDDANGFVVADAVKVVNSPTGSLPAPTVSSIVPVSGYSLGGTYVTITGTDFSSVTGVKFGTVDATSYEVNSTLQIVATAPPGSGTVDVSVTTNNGTSTNTSADDFTYTTGGVTDSPSISSISPTSADTEGGTSITITGASLTGATAVTFGGVDATSFTVDSSTQITATTPAHITGAVDILVTTANGSATIDGFYFFNFDDVPGTIIDNGDAGTSSTGAWSLSAGIPWYGNQGVYSVTAGDTYTLTAAETGEDRLFLWWTVYEGSTTRCTDVQVDVYDDTTLLGTTTVNQTVNGGRWIFIGTYTFSTSVKVVITAPSSACSTSVDGLKIVNQIANVKKGGWWFHN